MIQQKINKRWYSSILTVFFLVWQSPLYAQTNEVVEEQKESLNSVKVMGKDGFMLNAQYFAGKTNAAGVLLLHGCDHSLASYEKLLPLIAAKGLHALAVDFRGFGGSVSQEFNHLNIKRLSKDLATYQTEVSALQAFWRDDVLAAQQFIRERIEKDQELAVISIGCSAAQAIDLAQNSRINAFVMIAPLLNYMQKESFKNLIDIPTYFLDSVYHSSYQTSQELFNWNGDSRSIFQTHKGGRDGHSILNSKKYTAEHIAIWLDDTLNSGHQN